MPLQFSSKQPHDGHHDEKPPSFGRVSTYGQVALNFHQNTSQLKYWWNKYDSGTTTSVPTQSQRLRKGSHVDAFGSEKTSTPARPRLNIAIHICGSRGDVQPFIPIAKILQSPPHGHRVRICTHPAFKDFVESNGIEFFSISGDPEQLMAYMVKNPGLIPGIDSIKAGDIGKRRKGMAEMFEGTWRSCIEAGNGMGEKIHPIDVEEAEDLFLADVIIANPPSMGHIHCAEKLGIPLHIVFTMPWSPTTAFHHPLAAMEYGEVETSMANYFSYGMMELLTFQGLGDLINKFRTQTLKLDAISPLWGHQLIPRLRVPFSYLWSQSLIPRPADWDEHISITGFSFLKAGTDYTPPEDLANFLAAGPPPVYIGFGSIVVDDPAALTKLIFEAVKMAKVRAIVSKGWGGVGGGEVPDDVYLIGNCPHDWLFQRVSCVVHHGGAGTTAAGIALGKPTVVVPFFGDQPFWGQMIAKAGAGPFPVPFKQMTSQSLAESITFALKDDVKVAVQRMGESIAEEDGAADTVRDFEQRLDLDAMRCDLCPERLAVWRDKQTGAHLSGYAVIALCQKGLLRPKQLRLLRHKHWYTHEGAEEPIVGAVAAFGGLMSSIGTDTTEFSQRLKKKTHSDDIEAAARTVANNAEEELDLDSGITSKQFNHLAYRMASKSYEEDETRNFTRPQVRPGLETIRRKVAKAKVKGGRGYQITSATSHYAFDLAVSGAKAPVAFFYNVANGYRNFASYAIRNDPVRQREEIKGFSTGCKLAGKEFVLGFVVAFGGIIKHPYLGAKQEGPGGFGKGIARAAGAFHCHSMAAIFGLLGYFLKGIEKELLRRHLTTLQAEMFLIQLRRAALDFHQGTAAEEAAVLEKWKVLKASIVKQ